MAKLTVLKVIFSIGFIILHQVWAATAKQEYYGQETAHRRSAMPPSVWLSSLYNAIDTKLDGINCNNRISKTKPDRVINMKFLEAPSHKKLMKKDNPWLGEHDYFDNVGFCESMCNSCKAIISLRWGGLCLNECRTRTAGPSTTACLIVWASLNKKTL